ncbi:hypothetical protein SESBI_10017 [Sesbania bispinosa]|nr:hypothetical protein SESBI_10017 [Sesbania bispinosa]
MIFLRNNVPIDCGFLLENEDLPARLHQSLDKIPPKADVPQTLVNEKAMRRWLKKAGGDPGAQASENQPTASTNERRKKQKLDVQGDAQSKIKATEEKHHVVKVTPTIPQPQPNMNPPAVQKQLGAHMPLGSQIPSSSLPPSMFDKWWALFNNFEGPEAGEIPLIPSLCLSSLAAASTLKYSISVLFLLRAPSSSALRAPSRPFSLLFAPICVCSASVSCSVFVCAASVLRLAPSALAPSASIHAMLRLSCGRSASRLRL